MTVDVRKYLNPLNAARCKIKAGLRGGASPRLFRRPAHLRTWLTCSPGSPAPRAPARPVAPIPTSPCACSDPALPPPVRPLAVPPAHLETQASLPSRAPAHLCDVFTGSGMTKGTSWEHGEGCSWPAPHPIQMFARPRPREPVRAVSRGGRFSLAPYHPASRVLPGSRFHRPDTSTASGAFAKHPQLDHPH